MNNAEEKHDKIKILNSSLEKKYGITFDVNSLYKAITSSRSKIDKLLADFSEEEIRQKNILPAWKWVGAKRVWTSINTAIWLLETKKIGKVEKLKNKQK